MQHLSKFIAKKNENKARLLIVDDDAVLCASLRQQFLADGFRHIYEIGSAIGLCAALKEILPDLILLNIHMPDGNGVEICKELRKEGFAKPIVMLAAKNAEADIVKCLEVGANDYIIKPLRIGDLLACIHTQLKKFKISNDSCIEIVDLSFEPANKMLHKIGCSQMQVLTEKEAKILIFMFRAFPNSVSKDEILTEVWGLKNGLTTHTLETHIYRLRQKIRRLTEVPVVVTTPDGYRLEL